MVSKKNAPLKDIIKTVISNIEKKEKDESDILALWKKTAGKTAAKRTTPAFLKAGRLVINVSDSSWLYRLTLEKKKLIQKFNAGLKGKKKIKELQFRIGEIR